MVFMSNFLLFFFENLAKQNVTNLLSKSCPPNCELPDDAITSNVPFTISTIDKPESSFQFHL